MGRIGTFILGIAVGAVGLHTAMNFHVVRAADGTHLVRKMQVGLGGTYADVRHFGLDDWRRNPHLARAMVRAQQQYDGQDALAGAESLKQRVGAMLGTITGRGQ